MATSSILENIRVNNPKAVEKFVAAMETSANKPIQPRSKAQRSCVVTDPKRLKAVVRKGLKKRGIK